MSYLIIRKQGKDFKKILLDKKREYIIGRSQDSDIELEKIKGISRKHLKIYFHSDEVWVVELLSDIGSLIQGEEEKTKIELKDGDLFSVPPYVFFFKSSSKENEKVKSQEESKENKKEKASKEENSEVLNLKLKEETFHLDNKNRDFLSLGSDLESSVQKKDLDLKSTDQEKLDLKNVDKSEQPEGEGDKKTDLPLNLKETISKSLKEVPLLKISYNDRSLKEEKIHLNIKSKNEWILGRSQSSCDIVLKDKKISGKHLKIILKEATYFVEDLNSSNGTQHNDEKLTPKVQKKLLSGDQLKLGKVKLTFENKIRDYSIQLKKIEKKSKEEKNFFLNEARNFKSQNKTFHNEKNAFFREDGSPLQKTILGAKKIESQLVDNLSPTNHETNSSPPNKKRKKIIHLIIFVSLIFLGCFILFQDTGKKKNKTEKKDLSSLNQKKAPVEQDPRIKEMFLSARKYYMEGKYELCKFKIQKLHQKVDFYENSQELESLCLQAFELRAIEEEKAKMKKEKKLADQKLKKIINDCRNKMTKKTTLEEIKTCLFPAQEIDPMNTLINDLIFEVEIREQEKEELRRKRAKYKSRVNSGLKLYKVAEDLYNSGELKKALKAYKKFIKSPYPDPDKNKEKARRTFASIITSHNKKTENLLKNCRQRFKDLKFQEAFNYCKKVSKALPFNEEAKKLKEDSLIELRKVTKGLFIDSVLHESVGNLELAIKKWKRIIELSVEEDDYYSRSKRKLQTYEGRL